MSEPMSLIRARARRRRLVEELTDLRVQVADNRAVLTALVRDAGARAAMRELRAGVSSSGGPDGEA